MLSQQTTNNLRATLPRLAIDSIVPLAGDGSDRRYYRIYCRDNRTLILMVLPPVDQARLAAGNYDWLDLADLLTKQDIPCPRIIAELDHGLVIEDCGDVMLNDCYQQRQLFKHCFSIIGEFINLKPDDHHVCWQRRFTSEAYRAELDFFRTMFIDKAINLQLTATARQQFIEDSAKLSDYLEQFSNFFVHKDFHSRNLMVVDGSRIKVIDFQDACLGSPLYDLISLCFDSYLPLSNQDRRELFVDGCQQLNQRTAIDTKHWPALLLQRQLKAIGSFAKLTIVSKKGNYLKYVQPALATLTIPEIANSDWSFLSQELIVLLQEHSKRLS